jgi:hypothetical protein|tara:strand:- start:1005 stop:1232 length:228 start_codon:yes stop_codon:yes gene_type:complete
MAVLVRLGEAGMGVMRYGGVCRAMAAPEGEQWLGVSRSAQLGRGGECPAVAATDLIGAQGQGQACQGSYAEPSSA